MKDHPKSGEYWTDDVKHQGETILNRTIQIKRISEGTIHYRWLDLPWTSLPGHWPNLSYKEFLENFTRRLTDKEVKLVTLMDIK